VALYNQVRNARNPISEEVLSVYEAVWEVEWSDDVRVVKKEFTPVDYRAVGMKCLQMYCERNYPYDDGIVLGLEEGFSIALSDSAILNGFIDRLMKTSGNVYLGKANTKTKDLARNPSARECIGDSLLVQMSSRGRRQDDGRNASPGHVCQFA